ncbi:dipeptidase [Culicoidibacter larvae]|uniref:Membrane dipeptidase n=1 Tax=Culicoidibacter larvae TaxID=2579976 RepID=A0A5R8Q9J8_9FIRM|nr:membrane dipeptidase [Culicoidibacter larvae]TLG72517.1 hypothetical protein FEZ08_09010 [Culicoidibacter larvae]
MKVFDAHLDTFYHIALADKDGSKALFKNEHFPKLQKGETKAGVFVIYTEGDSPEAKYEQALDIMMAMSRELYRNRDIIMPITSSADFDVLEASDKTGIILGIEGMEFLEVNFDLLYVLAQMGVRHGGLTWNEANAFAAGAGADDRLGLTDWGKTLVRRMEDLHMVVDLAHANEQTFYDVYQMAARPFIVSHSAAYELFNHPRNLKDAQLQAVAEIGGLIGVNAWGGFLAEENPHIDDYMRHLVYIADKIGVEHVGLGFDFCDFLPGYMEKPLTKNLETSNQVQNLVAKLREHGFSEQEVQAICYDNYANFFRKWL